MDLQLITDNGVGTYKHSPLPGVVINNSIEHEEDSAVVNRRVVTWDITGVLLPDSGQSLVEQVSALESHYQVGSLVSAKITDGNTDYETLDNDDGIRVTKLDFPEGNGPEWASKRTYVISLEGVDYFDDDKGTVEYTVSYDTEQSGIITRTISGLQKDAEQDSYVKYVALKAANSWGTWAGANSVRDEYTTNKKDTETTFTIIHQVYWLAFPTGITNGSVNTEQAADSSGITKIRVNGWFEGSEASCDTAINTVRPSNVLYIRSSSTRDKYANRTSFSFEYISKSTDILYYQETIQIQAGLHEFVHKRILGGAPPIKQYTSVAPVRIVQSGIVRRLSSPPEVQVHKYPVDSLVSKRISRVSAEVKSGLEHTYVMHYSYEYEMNYNPGFDQ